MEILDLNGKLIAKVISTAQGVNKGLNFYSEPNDLLQVAVWAHPKGQSLSSHKHLMVERRTSGTAEVIFVIAGSIHFDVYDDENTLLSEGKLVKGDILICLAGGHGYQILDSDTQVLEIKNGPYFGLESDKILIPNLCTNTDISDLRIS
jgi:quercetin dioxygenase-like cupin family protein